MGGVFGRSRQLLPNKYFDPSTSMRKVDDREKVPQSGVGSMQGSSIQQRSSSTEGLLPMQVVFHHRSSSTEGCLPPKVVFHHRSSSTKGRLSPKVVFHQKSSSPENCL